MPNAYTKLLTVKFLLNCVKIWEMIWSYENFKKLKLRGDLREKMCFSDNFNTYVKMIMKKVKMPVPVSLVTYIGKVLLLEQNMDTGNPYRKVESFS